MQLKEYLETTSRFSMLSRFMLEHGRRFEPDADTFAGPRGKQGQCYMNAFRAMLDSGSLLYAEGLVSFRGIPIEHAWCVTPDGRAVDPTIGTPDRIEEFYGVVFDTQYVLKTALRTEVYGILSLTNDRIKQLVSGEEKGYAACGFLPTLDSSASSRRTATTR